eukprot:gene12407-12542_t
MNILSFGVRGMKTSYTSGAKQEQAGGCAEYNQKQVQGFYTRILRDEITAEWLFASGAAAPAELHIYCHVSGEEKWLAPPQLRNFIFRREMTLVLDTFAFADSTFLQAYPELNRAKVYVHFQSDVQDLDLREYWGTLGDRSSWRRMPKGLLTTNGCRDEWQHKYEAVNGNSGSSVLVPAVSTTLQAAIQQTQQQQQPLVLQAQLKLLRDGFNSTSCQVKCLAYLSSTGVYGDWGGAWVDESCPPRPSTARGLLRLEAEQAWTQLALDLDVPLTIFRLGGIYGPNRSVLNNLQKQAQPSSNASRRSQQRFTSRCHVADIVQAVLADVQRMCNASTNSSSGGGDGVSSCSEGGDGGAGVSCMGGDERSLMGNARAPLGRSSLVDVINVVDDEPAPRLEVEEYAAELLMTGSRDKLGPGSYDGLPCAIKTVSVALDEEDSAHQLFVREARILQACDHRCIIKFKALCRIGEHTKQAGKLALVLEYAKDGTLSHKVLKQVANPGSKVYSNAQALRWALDIASALEYLHMRSPAVFHRDVKLSNILCVRDECGQSVAKLSDFGLHVVADDTHKKLLRTSDSQGGYNHRAASPFAAANVQEAEDGVAAAEERTMPASSCIMDLHEDSTWPAQLKPPLVVHIPADDLDYSQTGTAMYTAPEVTLGLPYNEKVDVFSFGVLLYELTARCMLFFTELPTNTSDASEPDRYAAKVAQGYRPSRPKKMPQELWELISACWQQDPIRRPHITEVIGAVADGCAAVPLLDFAGLGAVAEYCWLAGCWLLEQVVAVLTELLEVEEGHQRPAQAADKRHSKGPGGRGPSVTATSTFLAGASGAQTEPELSDGMFTVQNKKLVTTAEDTQACTKVKATCACVIC